MAAEDSGNLSLTEAGWVNVGKRLVLDWNPPVLMAEVELNFRRFLTDSISICNSSPPTPLSVQYLINQEKQTFYIAHGGVF